MDNYETIFTIGLLIMIFTFPNVFLWFYKHTELQIIDSDIKHLEDHHTKVDDNHIKELKDKKERKKNTYYKNMGIVNGSIIFAIGGSLIIKKIILILTTRH